MCTTRLYTERYPDGHREKSYRYERCNEARLGLPCLESASSSRSRTTQPTYYPETYLPPTPSYTPVSSTPVYRSGDDSDRSYHSSSSTGRRRSGRYYVTDNQYLEVNPRSYRPVQRESVRRAAERVVIVESPPTPRTPPQTFTFPHSAPSSPNFGHSVPHVVQASPRVRDTTRRRPIIVDERPRPRVQIVEPSPERTKSHSRNGSAEKPRPATTTTTSSSRDQEKLERQRAEIARQNAEINSRPSVPVSRPLKRSTTSYTPAAFDTAAEVTDPFARLDLNRDQRREERARRQEEKAEQEAMDRRLRERLMPRRRATVGPGTRRHRVLYDDDLYRWE